MIIQKPPKAIEIDGVIYPINTNWFDCLSIVMAFEDKELEPQEQQEVLLYNLYGDNDGNLPDTITADTIQQFIEKGVKFLDCGQEGKGGNRKDEPRLYSIKKDWEYIYTAILTMNNGIDLYKADDLHFWTFMSYFMGACGCENFFAQLIHLRRQNYKGKLTKEERIQFDNLDVKVTSLEEVDKAEHEAFERYLSGE